MSAWVSIAALAAPTWVFVWLHQWPLALGTLVFGLAIGALLRRGRKLVIEQNDCVFGAGRISHLTADTLVLTENAVHLRPALRVLSRWSSTEPRPTPTVAAALGVVEPDWSIEQHKLAFEAQSMVANGQPDGAAGPSFYVAINGHGRATRQPPDNGLRDCWLIPTELRVPAHQRAYLAFTPERARRIVAPRFRLVVTGVRSVNGRGTIVEGTVTDAPVRVGQEVAVLRGDLFVLTTVRGIEGVGSAVLNEAPPGTTVGLTLQGLRAEEVIEGDVLMTPDDVPPNARRR